MYIVSFYLQEVFGARAAPRISADKQQIRTNHFNISCVQCFMQYSVHFVPDIDDMGDRKALVLQHQSKIGKYIFDSTMLYCVKRMAQVKLP